MSQYDRQLIFCVHHSEHTGANEDLASGQGKCALEPWVRIEVKAVGELTLRVQGQSITHGLQIGLEFCRLWCRLHLFEGNEFVGQYFADTNLVCVAEWRCCLSKRSGSK